MSSLKPYAPGCLAQTDRDLLISGAKISGSILARNTLLNLVGQAVPILIGAVTIPFVVRGLGTDRFGLLSLAWVILGYIIIFDLGLGRATTKLVAEALGRGEEWKVPQLVWTTVALQVGFGVLGLLVLVCITPLLVNRLLNIPSQLVGEAETIFYLLALSIPVTLVSTSLRGVLEAAQRFDLVNAVKVPFSTAHFLLPLLGILLGWDLPGVVMLLVMSWCLVLIAHYRLCIRVIPSLKGLPSVHREQLRALIGFGGWVMVSNVVGPILLYLDRFLIGVLLTMSAVAYYSAPFEVITRLGIIPASLAMTLFPAFSTIGTTQNADLRRLYIRSIKYLLLFTGPIVLILAMFAEHILRFWLGSDFAHQSTLVFQILLVGTFIGLLAPVPGSLLQGLGRPDILAKLYLLYLPLNLGMVWLLVKNAGIVGAALSFSLRTIIDVLLLFIVSSKFIHLHYTSEKGLWRSVTTLSGFGALLWGVSFIGVFPAQIVFVIILLLLYIFGTWNYVLNEIDRSLIISVKKGILREVTKNEL